MQLFDLSNEVAVVIGATGVLGGAMAQGLAAAGAVIAVVGRNAERGAARVAEIQKQGGTAALFDQLKETLTGERSSIPYAEIGQRLGMSEGAVKVAVHRLRQHYREQLRAEIAETVASPGEVEDELRHLFTVLSGT